MDSEMDLASIQDHLPKDHLRVKLGPDHRQNLRRLAQYLELPPTMLGAEFHMGAYTDCNDPWLMGSWEDSERTTCGSVGCAIGQAPYAGIKKLPEESWKVFSERVFGVGYGSFASGLSDKERYALETAWDFLFSAYWVEEDNTPQGCANRIYTLLEHGIPMEFVEEWESM